MANLSISFTAGQVDTGPDKAVVGALAPNAGAVEVRISNTNLKSKLEILRLLDGAKRYIEDGRFDTLSLV